MNKDFQISISGFNLLACFYDGLRDDHPHCDEVVEHLTPESNGLGLISATVSQLRLHCWHLHLKGSFDVAMLRLEFNNLV